MTKYLLMLAAVLACSSNNAHAAVYNLSGSLDALQAGTNGGFGGFSNAVAGAGNGNGMIVGQYDDQTNLLDYTLTFADLTSSVSVMHFHLGGIGVSGGVELPIPGTSPLSLTGVMVPEGNEPNLLAGNWYVNVHTANFGGGEIRGQVNVTAVPEPSSSALLGFCFVTLCGTCRRRLRRRCVG